MQLPRDTLPRRAAACCPCMLTSVIKSVPYSAISIESDYFLRTVRKETKDNIIYISAIRTTVLNNKAGSFNRRTMTLEFQEIDKIVYVDKNGAETLLWSE